MLSHRIITIILILSVFISGCRKKTKTDYWPNGKLKSEIHLRGEFYNGKATWWYESGMKQMECFYKNNLLDSTLIRWYEDGKKEEELHYRNNKPDGVNTAWEIGGNMTFQRNYINGLLDGPCKEWYPNKELKSEGQYKMGNIDGKWLYYDNTGVIIGYGTFSNGNGKQKAFYDNGVLKSETNYINNLKEGVEKVYDISGKLQESRIYEAGVLHETNKK